MFGAPKSRLSSGTFWSGVGHAGIILWVLVGDWLFSSHKPPQPVTTTVTMMSEAAFAQLQATTSTQSETGTDDPLGQDEAAPAEPVAEPAPAETPPVETAPAKAEPAPLEPAPAVVEPVAAPDARPEPQLDPQPETMAVAPEEQLLPSMSTSLRPKPKPADLVRPDPTPAPPPEAVSSDTPEPAVSEAPAEIAAPPQEAREETVAEESGDIMRTEATEEQEESVGMQASTRPRARPQGLAQRQPDPKPEPKPEVAAEKPVEKPADKPADKPAEKPAEKPAKKPAEKPAEKPAQSDAIAAALAEAASEPASKPAGSSAGSASGTGRNAPVGPPLNAGEMGDISSAIARKWNLGAVSSDVERTIVVLRVEFDQTGKPGAITLVDNASSGPTPGAIDIAFQAGRRAIQRAYMDGGIPLPPEKYETWKVVEFEFDANGMRMR